MTKQLLLNQAQVNARGDNYFNLYWFFQILTKDVVRIIIEDQDKALLVFI